MNVDRNRLFEEVSPPPGGRERFRERLAGIERRSARAPVRRFAAAAAIGALLAAVIAKVLFEPAPEEAAPATETARTAAERTQAATETARTATQTATPAADAPADAPSGAEPGSLYLAPELDRLLGRAPEAVEVSVSVNGEEARLRRVASSDPRIRVYMVADDNRTDRTDAGRN